MIFLFDGGTYCPSPAWVYIYAIFFHPDLFTLKMEAVLTSEMLVSYNNTTIQKTST